MCMCNGRAFGKAKEIGGSGESMMTKTETDAETSNRISALVKEKFKKRYSARPARSSSRCNQNIEKYL